VQQNNEELLHGDVCTARPVGKLWLLSQPERRGVVQKKKECAQNGNENQNQNQNQNEKREKIG
jgi:hypothetical protein